MTLQQIASLGRKLTQFLRMFAGVFGRPEGRRLLAVYVRGQLSDIHRKNSEAIALEFREAPRTLQRFLESIKWDHAELRDQQQKIIATEHAHPEAIGCVDESGTVKSGKHTAGAARQYNGNRGKVENCNVAVHLSYSAPGFQVLLDSRLYLKKEWAHDAPRRKQIYIPDEIAFQTKPQIALDLIDHSLANGVRVAAWTFDELYGRDTKFLDGLQQRQQAFVGEVPCNFHGWVREPNVIFPREKTGQVGRPESRTRVAKRYRSCEVRNFLKHSPVLRKKKFQRYRIKDTGRGPQIWEVKWTEFWRKDADGLPVGSHCLIVARNVLTGEVKFFLSNRVPGRGGVTLRWLLRVAFGRWSVESVFREAKDELGLDHYQCRGWQCIHRHFAVTALSHLFCARMRQEFDETNGPGRLSIEQVRSAINVWLSTADLPLTNRRERYQAELDKQAYYQRRSQQAAESHRQTRIAQYLEIGIDPNCIKSGIPKPDI